MVLGKSLQVFGLAVLFYNYASATDYNVWVRTHGDIGAGTDADVFIQLFGEKGDIGERELNHPGRDDFEKGKTDSFTLGGLNDIGRIKFIKLKRTDGGILGDWNLDWVDVAKSGSSNRQRFRYDGWFPKNSWKTIPLTGCSTGYRQGVTYCEDVNECQEQGHKACVDTRATCQNTDGSHICKCPAGFDNVNNGYCTDVDECKLNTCGSNTDCTNTEGSFVCNCKTGYAPVSPLACEDINECAGQSSPCNEVSVCRNIPGSYACDCKAGYYKPTADSPCIDVDECHEQNYDCRPVGIASCVNTPGTYRCACKDGYQNQNQNLCVDKDECASSSSNVCDIDKSTCRNFDGGYSCACKDGYRQGSTNKICEGVICPALVGPSGGQLQPSRCTQNNANRYTNVCNVTCNDGYVLEDPNNNKYTCGAQGRWEGVQVVCKAVSCPALSAISSGGVWPDTCHSTGRSYGQTCSYYCDGGYKLEGGATRTCKQDGTWDGAEPTCSKDVRVPWISCPPSIRVGLQQDKSTADVSASWKEPISNVQPITIHPSNLGPSFQYPAGQTKVTWSVTNSAGSASCTIYVTVIDNQAPTVKDCPTSSIFKETSESETAVTWTEPTFMDNVGVTKQDSTHQSGHVFKTGTYNVYYEAADAAGNRAACEFKVVVKRKGCPPLSPPLNGALSCQSFGGQFFCTASCQMPNNQQLFKSPSKYQTYWSCGSSGEWDPPAAVPDCVEAAPNDGVTACPDGQERMDVQVFGTPQKYCGKCPTGTSFAESRCHQCTAGKYQDEHGQLSCKACPQGTTSLAGARNVSECTPPCPAGKFSEDGLGPNCMSCPFNMYQDQVGQTKCEPCPDGTHTEHVGATKPGDCGVDPKVTSIVPDSKTIKEKTDVSFECRGTGVPRPSFLWKFLQGIPASHLGRMTQEPIKDGEGNIVGSKLVIQGAEVENTGSYECTATNTHGKAASLAQLTVEAVEVGPGFGSGGGQL